MKTPVYKKGLHERTYTVRLTEEDADLLEAVGRYQGIKAAVLLRSFAKQNLRLFLATVPTLPERAAVLRL